LYAKESGCVIAVMELPNVSSTGQNIVARIVGIGTRPQVSVQSITGKTELIPPNAIQRLDAVFTNLDDGAQTGGPLALGARKFG
jgi:hypothetical protein